MTAPRILSLSAALRQAPALVQRASRAGLLEGAGACFVVTVAGELRGHLVERGSVIVCGAPASELPVVLEPFGHGRACLGELRNGVLVGEHGESCSPRRWSVAGAVVEIRHVGGPITPSSSLSVPSLPARATWQEPQSEQPGPWLALPVEPQQAREPAEQLTLFVAAA